MVADAAGLIRDRYGRPLIKHPEEDRLIPYTRVSTLAKALSDSTGLTNWKMRQLVVGASMRPDLLTIGASAYQSGDTKSLDDTAQKLLESAGSSASSNVGTALHTFLELVDKGETPLVPEQYKGDIEAYRRVMDGIEVLAMERFIVNDEVRAAGTFDRLVKLRDGKIVVGDIKTGSTAHKYPLPVSMQIATYSRGHIYDPDSKPNPRKGLLTDYGVDPDVGLLIHIPAGTGEASLWLLDLRVGWEAAKTAVRVRDWNKDKAIIQQYNH